MKTIEETMFIIHLENNHRKINTPEEIEILKNCLLCDAIPGQNYSIYKLLPLIRDLNSKINSPGQAIDKILKTNYYSNP